MVVGKSLNNALPLCFVTAFILSPIAAVAEPVKLKLAYFTSDQARSYKFAIKPFVDAVNGDERGGIKIETYPSGALGKDTGQQAQLVRDGIADIAYVVLGEAANQFPDHAVIELPGLFRDLREATLVNNQLVDSGLLGGYNEFFVVGSFATEAESIHTRPPVASLDDLSGMRIRANNPIEASVLAKLGMYSVVLPIAKTAEAISRGTIDGAATATVPLIDFGLGRVATYHYYLRLGASVRSILMDRKKFENLPQAGRDVIRKYGGEWLAESFIRENEPYNADLFEQLKSDPLRKVIFPSQSDIEVAEEAFRAVQAEWGDKSLHHRQLLNATQAAILKYRSEQAAHAVPLNVGPTIQTDR